MSAVFAGTQAVLFDLDGTLIDSAPDLGAAADQMRTARGLPSLPLERYRSMAGAGALWHDARPPRLRHDARGVLCQL